MKLLKFMLSLLSASILLGCSTVEEIPENNVEVPQASVPSDEVDSNEENVPTLEEEFQVFRLNHQLSLINLMTGEEVAAYEFLEEEWIEHLWELEDGYFAVFVQEEDLVERGFRLDVDWSELESKGIPSRFVVLDSSLNVVVSEIFTEEGFEEAGLSIGMHSSYLTFVDGELFLYGELRQAGSGIGTGEIIRHHVQTGETEMLVQHQEDFNLNILGFLNESQLAVYAFSGMDPNVFLHYGILNLDSREFQLLERRTSGPLEITFNNPYFLILENPELRAFDFFNFQDEIVVANLQTLEEAVVPVEEGDSGWARLTLDQDGIVSVNEELEVLRVYGLDGEILAETPLSEDLPDFVTRRELFLLGTDAFAIAFLDSDQNRHVQVIALDGGE